MDSDRFGDLAKLNWIHNSLKAVLRFASQSIDRQIEKAPILQSGLANKVRYRVGESNPSFIRERDAS